MYQVPLPQTAMIPNQSYPMQQNLAPVTSSKKISVVLICFAVALSVVTTILCCWCIWIMTVNSSIIGVHLALVSCVYHIILSIFALVGGKDTVKQRCVVVTCFGLAIIGIYFFIFTNLIFNWDDLFSVRIVVTFQEIFDISISIVSSHFIRKNSCIDTTSGSSSQPPFYQNGQTQQLAFNNPQYTFHQPYNSYLPPINLVPATQDPQ